MRDGTDWFESLYAAAEGDPGRVPWAAGEPKRELLWWLDQPGLDVTGADTLVVGCGLGDDAAELSRRGARVTAFDISETAVDWARERFGDTGVDFHVADLFDLPERWTSAFGLVVEIRTVQSLAEGLRRAAMTAVAGTVGEGGVLLHVGLMATLPPAAMTWQGPPWPLAPAEFDAYADAGLERIDLAHPPEPDGEAMEVVMTLRRPEGAGSGRPEGAGSGRPEGAGSGRPEGAGSARPDEEEHRA